MKAIRNIFCVIVLLSVVYAGYMFGMPLWRHYDFKTASADLIRLPNVSVEEMKKKILEAAAQSGVENLPDDAVEVMIDDRGQFLAKIKYKEVVDLIGLYQYTYDFNFILGQ